jgi:hypothetical protein
MTDIFTQKNPKQYCCKKCDFFSCNKKDYSRHILTSKHKKNNEILTETYTNTPENPSSTAFSCDCGNIYKHRQSLWNHKKKCKQLIEPKVEIQQPTNELVMSLLNQNMELQKQIIDLCKDKNTVINNNTTNNNTNNCFNINFFLNEQCKDALNIEDFVNQIKLQLSDLDMIGRVGYAEGISKIFIRNLQELDVYKRPIHCSDLKRETLYVKDNNTWEKENGENNKIKRVIKQIECKNIKQIPQWQQENPTSEDTDTKKHMEYKNIVLQAMGGSMLEDDNKKQKLIIRNIAKETVIDKTLNKK